MRRSGHHAFIYWLRTYLPGSAIFFNDVSRDGYSFHWHQQGEPEDSRHCILNIEDKIVDGVHDFLEATPGINYYIGPVKRIKYFLVLRDPLNLFASRIAVSPKALDPLSYTGPHTLELYKDHAQYCLKQKSWPGLNIINYNLWVLSEDYRRTVGQSLGLEGDFHLPFERVLKQAQSSFDGKDYDHKASKMKLFERWKLLSNKKHLINMMSDPLIRSQALQLFSGIHPDYKNWLDQLGQ